LQIPAGKRVDALKNENISGIQAGSSVICRVGYSRFTTFFHRS